MHVMQTMIGEPWMVLGSDAHVSIARPCAFLVDVLAGVSSGTTS